MCSLTLTLAILLAQLSIARPPVLSGNESVHHPSKIIRTCCTFGADLRMGLVPFLRISDIVSIDDLGAHQYMGSKKENNGIIYTRRGGFIDIAHLRDVADWTGYLFNIITAVNGIRNEVELDMGLEGGNKLLKLNIQTGLDSVKACELAGMIAFDLSVWHEIASWFGASYIPLLPERYSSFSPEDLYSNLLGVQIGIKAILSDLEYNEAMTSLIASTLDSLGAVRTIDDTYNAMKKVEEIWWSNEKPLPSAKILLRRNFETGHTLIPWQLEEDKSVYTPYHLEKPDIHLEKYYQLSISLNRRFYRRAKDCLSNGRIVTKHDFHSIIDCISDQVDQKIQK
jgi:hypothetical protein